MLGREVKDDAMARITEETAAGGHGFEDAVAALDIEVTLEADGLGDEAHERLRAVDVEIVRDQMPLGAGGPLSDQHGEIGGEILVGKGVAEPIRNLPGDDAEGGDEDQRAVADVLELLPLGAPRAHSRSVRISGSGVQRAMGQSLNQRSTSRA